MSSKRPNNTLPEGTADSQLKKLKTSTKNNQHKRKEPPSTWAAAVRAGSKNEQCTFQSLGDDEICHILSFLLCLPKPVKAPKMPSPAFVYHQKSIFGDDGVELTTLGVPVRGMADKLAAFRQLPDEERRKFYNMAGADWAVFNAQRARFKHYLKQRFFFPGELAESTRTLKLVCKRMHRVVSKFTNHSAPEEIISPEHLASIKARVGRLNLLSVCKSFIKLCDDLYCDRKFLSSDLYHQHCDDGDHCPLEFIARHYASSDIDSLAKLISVEYRKFLVVKAVELEAQRKKKRGAGEESSATSSLSSLSTWTKTSMPGQLVHTFWQAHMLSPRKYYADCYFVVGEIIDCEDSSYSDVDPKIVFEYYQKRKRLFAFDHQLTTKEHFHTGRQPALYMIENVIETASMLREEEAMEEHDDTDDDSSGDDHGEDEHTDNEAEAQAEGQEDGQEAGEVVHNEG